jgi:hypothetical protein
MGRCTHKLSVDRQESSTRKARTRYKGLAWFKSVGRWLVRVSTKHNGKQVNYCGNYHTDEAVAARQADE